MEVGAPVARRADSNTAPRNSTSGQRPARQRTQGPPDRDAGALEIQSADRVDLLCAFVRFAGVRLIRRELQEFLLRGGADARHRERLHGLHGEASARRARRARRQGKGVVRDVQTRLHAKAWLFERNTGFHTAYVGSSNLTQLGLPRRTRVERPSDGSREPAHHRSHSSDVRAVLERARVRALRPAARWRPLAGRAGRSTRRA